jgi:hypothetical protein
VQPVAVSPAGHWVGQSIFCDPAQWWFLQYAPYALTNGAVTVQAVPLEWASSGSSPKDLLKSSEAVVTAATGSASVWMLLDDGRLLHYLDDEAYGRYQGSPVIGQAPSDSTEPIDNQAPAISPISGEAQYNYDTNGNYMGGTISLNVTASDPDGDAITITWSVNATSGSPALATGSGWSNLLVLDSFSSGTVFATATDAKGASSSSSFSFSSQR